MTEQEWQRSDDAYGMLVWFLAQWSGGEEELNRLMMRYWQAGCRRIWKLLPHKGSRRSLKVLERFLDGDGTYDDIDAVEWVAEDAKFCFEFRTNLGQLANWTRKLSEVPPEEIRRLVGRDDLGQELTPPEILEGAAWFAHRAFCNFGRRSHPMQLASKPFLNAPLLREVVGNPFRPTAINPAWLAPRVVELLDTIHGEENFDLMPILGDALEDAGCPDEAIQAHVRGPNVHVRGCWVVDTLRAKR